MCVELFIGDDKEKHSNFDVKLSFDFEHFCPSSKWNGKLSPLFVDNLSFDWIFLSSSVF